MARVTVEDCVTRIPNRFDLVMRAARRARDISAGAPLTLDRDNDKNPVVALREIAEGTIDLAAIEEMMVRSYQRHVELEEPEEELMELSVTEEEMAREVEPSPLEGVPEEEVLEDELSVEGEPAEEGEEGEAREEGEAPEEGEPEEI